MTWTFLPWQLGPARVVGNWQRGNSPPTKTARDLTKHRFMGMCLWVWLKGGSWKIMQHLNHQFGLPKEWTRNKNTCAVIWRYLLACCLSPQGSRMRHWVYQRDTIWLNCLSLHFTCQKSPWKILKLCSFTIHVHLYESTINWYIIFTWIEDQQCVPSTPPTTDVEPILGGCNLRFSNIPPQASCILCAFSQTSSWFALACVTSL